MLRERGAGAGQKLGRRVRAVHGAVGGSIMVFIDSLHSISRRAFGSQADPQGIFPYWD